jgi:nucleoside-diphosphate-sugar epimerase
VINRFIVQAILNEPLTIYGDGEQKRGFLALNDSVQCLDLFVKNPPKEKEMRIVNQLDEVFSMNEIADKVINTFKKEFDIEVTKTNIESPRVENTNDFYYNPHTEILKSLGFKQTRTIEDEIKFAWQHFDVSTFNKLRENVIPKIK